MADIIYDIDKLKKAKEAIDGLIDNLMMTTKNSRRPWLI